MSDITIQKERSQLECQCKNKVFAAVVTPSIEDGSAEIIELYCTSCQRGVNVNQGKLGARKIQPEQNVRIDDLGRKHYGIKAETGYLGFNNFNH